MKDTIHKPRLGIYAGSFDPFHIGHLDVVKQAAEVFDKVLVAKGINPEKDTRDTYPVPLHFLNDMGIYVRNFDGLLVELIKECEKEFNVTLVRGLRSGADLDYEQNFAAFLRNMYPKVKIVAFYSDPQFRHISSTALRGIKKFSDAEYRKYVVED
jgi:pantetheine-phosphate adenylyltransferase